jgi:hypothetical protein
VVSRSTGIADMLVVAEGADSDSHWNDTARELLRGLLVDVAGLPAELRHIVTAPEDDLADTLACPQGLSRVDGSNILTTGVSSSAVRSSGATDISKITWPENPSPACDYKATIMLPNKKYYAS